MKNKKVDKISYPRYTKLIIAHFISRNNEIPKRSNADMHSEAHDELMQKIRKLAILMDQPQTVEPTKGTNRKPSASMVRGATKKIVVKQKKNVTFAESLTGYEDDDVRTAKLVSPDEERQRIEMERNSKLTLEKQIDTDGDTILNALKRQKLKGIETISPEEQELINDDISLGEFGLPRIAGLSRLKSRNGSSVEEKPDGDSFDIERLIVEPKTDEVPEVTMTEPTGLPQGGTTGLKYVLITPEATPTFVLTPGEI
nr:hypothetical protein [Tanacetum cinerariifolium]